VFHPWLRNEFVAGNEKHWRPLALFALREVTDLVQRIRHWHSTRNR
jgi:hypothetical protein